jgi:hypothetical protein
MRKRKPPDQSARIHKIDFGFTRRERTTILNFISAFQGTEMAVERQAGRYEIQCDMLTTLLSGRRARLPGFVRKNLGVCQALYGLIEGAIPRLLDALEAGGVDRPRDRLCWVSLFLVKAGAREQDVHTDAGRRRNYFTCFVPVTGHRGQGDTEFGAAEPFETLAGAKAWRGDVLHRGGRNRSRKDRVAFALVLSDREDDNRPVGRAFRPARA